MTTPHDIDRAIPHHIDRDAVYSLASATTALGLTKECLSREIRLGRLQARKRAGRYWITGAWLLEWLQTGKAHAAWDAAHTPQPAGNGRRERGAI
jgi:hypothetical protein